MTNENTMQQIELVNTLVSSQEERAKFISNPEAYFKALGYDVDESVKISLKSALLELEKEYAKIGAANPFITDTSILPAAIERGDETTMNVVAAAAAVSAAAAVVSAAAAVTTATSAAKLAK